MTITWAQDAVFYHVYPLGMLGAPARRAAGEAVPRLAALLDWIPHWQALGINALYLGPVFDSLTHGYDTSDYTRVDPRLGDNALLAHLIGRLHEAGIRVVLDAVLNHVGRDFWAFQDVLAHGPASAYASWFAGLRFDRQSPLGDPFSYDTWGGAAELVKLNLAHPPVRAYLLGVVGGWMREFGIDGLRLDAADCMDLGFLQALSGFCRAERPDFWLMGEVVHGDYTRWANPTTLDATTNYECYKGLYSSHNARNYFEIAHSLNRQFGPGGVYRGLPLYSFVDNHDVDRIASTLTHTPHLFPLHVLLFAMPGTPSIYYGSEWAVPGRKVPGSDAPLRPALGPAGPEGASLDLVRVIARLARVRQASPALRRGDYRQLHVAAEQLAFARSVADETVVVAINGADAPGTVELSLPAGASLVDLLDAGPAVTVPADGRIPVVVPGTWGRMWRVE